MSDLLAHVHPDRIAVCFRTAGLAGAKMLMNEPRFATRLADLIGRHYHLEEHEGEEDEVANAIFTLPLTELDRLALRAGVVLRARDFLQEIRGPVLVALSERFGPDALEDARRHVDLAGSRPNAPHLDGLEAAVKLDGLACLAAWIAGLPKPLGQRIRLKWPNDAVVPMTNDADVLERGPVILRRLTVNASASR